MVYVPSKRSGREQDPVRRDASPKVSTTAYLIVDILMSKSKLHI